MKNILKDIQKHLLSGVSFMMPLVVAGGVILAISLLGATQTPKGLVPNGPIMLYLNQLGKAGMAMMLPVFSAYIAYSIAGKPGLSGGFILGFIANSNININGYDVKAGFLGALILGLLSGYFAKYLKELKIVKNHTLRTIMPILIIPILSVLILGLTYYLVIALPISLLMDLIVNTIKDLSAGNKAIFAIFMGSVAELDFGGPITKSVSMFTLAMINEGILEPNGIFRILVAVPPIGIFMATILAKNKFTLEERNNAKAVGLIGCLGITEGAIPYAIKDPKAIFPASIIGSIVAALIGAFYKVTCPVPHGGFIVLPVVGQKLAFVCAILIGSLVMALILKLLKKDVISN